MFQKYGQKMWSGCEWISQLSPQHMWMLCCFEATDKEKPEIIINNN
jgi:hypothetical protein